MIVHLMGGLGNQLFQLAFGKQVAKARGEELEFTRFAVDADVKRSYSLGAFVGGQGLRFIPEPPRFIPRFQEQEFRYYNEVWDVNRVQRGSYFIGHWQTEKYLRDRALVLRDFGIVGAMSDENKKAAEDIQEAGEKAAFLHVRRTDYLDKVNQEYHGMPSLSYYHRAIAHIRERVADAKFFVFSDDVPWCKSYLPGHKGYFSHNKMGDRNAPGQEHWDILLMSLCRHSVIANSSFSWWSAWLGNPTGIRIAPEKWFLAKHLSYQDVVPQSWVKLGN